MKRQLSRSGKGGKSCSGQLGTFANYAVLPVQASLPEARKGGGGEKGKKSLRAGNKKVNLRAHVHQWVVRPQPQEKG